MPVLVEAISVIIRRSAIIERYSGGWSAFQEAIPNATGCHDENLVRIGFMVPTDVQAYVSQLEANGLIFRKNGEPLDITVVDQLRGATIPTPWIETGHIQLFEPEMKVFACWLKGQEVKGIATPGDWKFEGSLSAKPGFAKLNTEGDHLKFLRHEDGQDVYLDLTQGEEVYVGRPKIQGDSRAELFTQLKKICSEAMQLDAQAEPLKALGDEEGAAPIFQKLQEQLLPEAKRIADGPGKENAFAHFTHGLVLRILKQLPEAEAAFRQSHRLQPGIINTLLELVRCLCEQDRHRDALPFAREGTEVGPVDPAAWGNLAMCLIKCDEREEARAAIDFSIDLDPKDPTNRYIRDNFDNFFE